VLLFNLLKTLNDLFFLYQNVVAQARHPNLKQQPPRNQNPFTGTTELLCHLWTSPGEIENNLHILCSNSWNSRVQKYFMPCRNSATHGTGDGETAMILTLTNKSFRIGCICAIF
jgi:hypothetical protein